LANPNGVRLIGPSGGEINVVISRAQTAAGGAANGDVVITGVVQERLKTLGRVVVAGAVAAERGCTGSRVLATDCVMKRRGGTSGCVGASRSVVNERRLTGRRVAAADCVSKERRSTGGRVEDTIHAGDHVLCIASEGFPAHGRVRAPVHVATERAIT